MWVAEGVTEIWQSGVGTIAPSRPLPHVQRHNTVTSIILPQGTPKAPPLKVTDSPRQKKKKKKKAQMTEHFKAPEKIQLSKEEIANLLDAQFKTLVIKMLTELVEFGRKLDEKMKAMLRETKENV